MEDSFARLDTFDYQAPFGENRNDIATLCDNMPTAKIDQELGIEEFVNLVRIEKPEELYARFVHDMCNQKPIFGTGLILRQELTPAEPALNSNPSRQEVATLFESNQEELLLEKRLLPENCSVDSITQPLSPDGDSDEFGEFEDDDANNQVNADCEPCLICGGPAGKHIHYGGQSCYSCKAFFRRAVKDDAYKKFECTTKACSIDSKSWKSCRWCRFQKCLSSGLKPSWVLDKTERRRRREKKSTSHRDTSVDTSLVHPVSKANGMIFGYTADEFMQVITMGNKVHRGLTKNLMRFYGKNPTLFGQITSAIYNGSIVPYELYMKWETIWPNTAKDLVTKISGLKTLNPEDRATLIRHNFPAVQILIQSVLMENSQDFKASNMGETVQGSLLRSAPNEKNADDVMKLHDVLRSLNLVGMQMPENALTYDQVFRTPWASSIDLEDRHAYIIPKVAEWPVDKNDPLRAVDKVQLFLMYNIIMLSTDGANVSDYSKVTKLQTKYLNMLYRYMHHKYKNLPDLDNHFKEGMHLARLGREAFAIRMHRLPV